MSIENSFCFNLSIPVVQDFAQLGQMSGMAFQQLLNSIQLLNMIVHYRIDRVDDFLLGPLFFDVLFPLLLDFFLILLYLRLKLALNLEFPTQRITLHHILSAMVLEQGTDKLSLQGFALRSVTANQFLNLCQSALIDNQILTKKEDIEFVCDFTKIELLILIKLLNNIFTVNQHFELRNLLFLILCEIIELVCHQTDQG